MAAAMLLAACGGGSGGTADDRVAVVATTTQVGSIVGELGAEDVALTVLLQPGIEAHDFELTPAAGAAIEQADLVIQSGAGLESWLADALETIGGVDRLVDLSEGVDLRAPAGEAAGAEHEHIDPHYWLSGPNVVVMVENARKALIAAVPDAAEAINRRAEALVDRLEAADAEVRALIGEIPEERRAIVTDHDALGYFIDAYGLEFVGSVFSSLDVSAEPNARDLEELVAEIRAHHVRAIFTESSVNPRLAQSIAEETDARLVADPLYTDSLGAEGSGADTLDGMLVHNARVIHDALGGG